MTSRQMKPKKKKSENTGRVSKYDVYQTPFYALEPLIPYINRNWTIWEPAMGKGNIVKKLKWVGFNVFGTDLQDGHDFFEINPINWECQITNPPYSIKYKWIERSYLLGKPFALLLPLETLGAQRAQKLFEKYGIEIILLNRRVKFEKDNRKTYPPPFPVAWFTWGFDLGCQLIYGKITY